MHPSALVGMATIFMFLHDGGYSLASSGDVYADGIPNVLMLHIWRITSAISEIERAGSGSSGGDGIRVRG